MKAQQDDISRIMNSTEGMHRAEASPFLYGRIMERIRQNVPEPVYYTGKALVRFAVAVMVIAALNGMTLKMMKKYKNNHASEEQHLQQMAEEYFGEDAGYSY